jgi:hypothetical protein
MTAPTLALLTAPGTWKGPFVALGGAKQLAGRPVRACCLIERR